jgi:predicted amidohydrolase
MKVALAQTRPVPGDIPANIEDHLRYVRKAVELHADAVVFPELSLTGYEPSLAAQSSVVLEDVRFQSLREMSVTNSILIAVGVPTRDESGIRISMLMFKPNDTLGFVSKMYLHPDELPYFVPGSSCLSAETGPDGLAVAICYELSIPEHTARVMRADVECYVASVAKSKLGVDQAMRRLADIASEYSKPTMMVNSVGPADNFECDGRSAVWNNQGKLVVQLPANREGMIVVDTESPDTARSVDGLW